MKKKNKFFLCIKNKDCDDLEIKKVYRSISDSKSEKDGFLRIIDESGEDYLYPKSYFIAVNLPQAAIESISKVS